MILLKNSREIGFMQEAGVIAARALRIAGEAVEPGVTTWEIDRITRKYIEEQGAIPSFLGYRGFPATTCISLNDEVIHGIPSKSRVIKAGDIVSIDVAAILHGFHADNAYTYPCGDVSEEAKVLMEATQASLYKGIDRAQKGGRLGDISSAVQEHVEALGYSVVREYVGHGVGQSLHEDPSVPNFGTAGRGVRLLPGMTLAIEPMINAGRAAIEVMPDGWLVKTADGRLSAHFEHTVAITEDGSVCIITDPEL